MTLHIDTFRASGQLWGIFGGPPTGGTYGQCFVLSRDNNLDSRSSQDSLVLPSETSTPCASQSSPQRSPSSLPVCQRSTSHWTSKSTRPSSVIASQNEVKLSCDMYASEILTSISRRQGRRPLPRYSPIRWYRIRCLIQPWQAVVFPCR